jgi:hypothetical protein
MNAICWRRASCHPVLNAPHRIAFERHLLTFFTELLWLAATNQFSCPAPHFGDGAFFGLKLNNPVSEIIAFTPVLLSSYHLANV